MKTLAERWVAGVIYVIGVGYFAGLLWHMIDSDSAPSMDILLVGLIAHVVLGFWQVTWPKHYEGREPARHSEDRVSRHSI